MSSELELVKDEDDIETLAARARLERQERCSMEINAVLEKHNCQMLIALTMGDRQVLLNQIVALPGQVIVEAKPK